MVVKTPTCMRRKQRKPPQGRLHSAILVEEIEDQLDVFVGVVAE